MPLTMRPTGLSSPIDQHFMDYRCPLIPERLPASVSDMHSGLAASTSALDPRSCEASSDHLAQQFDCKPMR
jgi:hypothetical protein